MIHSFFLYVLIVFVNSVYKYLTYVLKYVIIEKQYKYFFLPVQKLLTN